MKIPKILSRVAIWLCALISMAALAADKATVNGRVIDPSQYPIIGEKEMGQLRWVLGIANQPLDDFTHLEAQNQANMTSYRYAIAFGTYFLALEQYHKLPAWPEAIQPAMDRYIQKILQKPVWEFWAQTSRGIWVLEPKLDKPYKESHDPVGEKNIMYSGHVGHMINLYEMLYHDFKWDQPGSIVFAWSDTEKYVYDNHSLEKVMHDQMQNNAYHAVCCEPNAVFPECNQHPVLSFMLYDHTHGTKLAAVNQLYFDSFITKQMIRPDTHETAMLYLVKQDQVLSQKNARYHSPVDFIFTPAVSLGIVKLHSASANGWTGTFMHAWQPQYIETQYPYWKKAWVVEDKAESDKLKNENWEPKSRYGFFAMLAAEMGDYKTRDRLLNFADKQYKPVWQDGTFHYPYNPSGGCTNLTDKLFAFARANSKNGLWQLHNQPFADDHFREPRLAKVDFPRVLVRRAIYDPSKKALIVTLDKGAQDSGSTSFEVQQIDPSKSYRLFIDGKETGKYHGQSVIEIKIDLDQKHDLILAEE